MQLGTSLLLIAVGAILKFAITASVSGVSLSTVGVILMVVGVIGLILSLFMMNQATNRTDTVVQRDVVDDRRRV